MRPSQELTQRLLGSTSRASRLQPLYQSRCFSRAAPFREAISTPAAGSNASPASNTSEPPKVPSYDMTFTCRPCSYRSTHRITKQGYHHGTVLITCPECKNRHVITDHLRVFNDVAKSFEEILMEKAAPGTHLSSLLKKGTLGFKGMTVNGQEVPMADGEAIEFWDEGKEATYEQHRADYKKEKQ